MSKDCDKAKTHLYEYLDEELDQVTAQSIQRHLDDCPDCSEPFDFERKLQQAVRKCLNEDLPPNLEAKLRNLIRQEPA